MQGRLPYCRQTSTVYENCTCRSFIFNLFHFLLLLTRLSNFFSSCHGEAVYIYISYLSNNVLRQLSFLLCFYSLQILLFYVLDLSIKGCPRSASIDIFQDHHYNQFLLCISQLHILLSVYYTYIFNVRNIDVCQFQKS